MGIAPMAWRLETLYHLRLMPSANHGSQVFGRRPPALAVGHPAQGQGGRDGANAPELVVTVSAGAPSVVNDRELANRLDPVFRRVIGNLNVVEAVSVVAVVLLGTVCYASDLAWEGRRAIMDGKVAP